MAQTFKRMLITAGPTREMLDPVRFLSNLSTGQMGYELARAAKKNKYKVTLISGPTFLKPPTGVRFIQITSAQELKKACERYFPKNDVLVMTAAVCDFTAARKHQHKIHRTAAKTFLLKQTPDIVAGLAKRKGRRFIIGFCLETKNWLEQAKTKLKKKRLDGIVANFYSKSHVPFGQRRITTALIDKEEKVTMLRGQSKRNVALRLLNWLENFKGNKAS